MDLGKRGTLSRAARAAKAQDRPAPRENGGGRTGVGEACPLAKCSDDFVVALHFASKMRSGAPPRTGTPSLHADHKEANGVDHSFLVGGEGRSVPFASREISLDGLGRVGPSAQIAEICTRNNIRGSKRADLVSLLTSLARWLFIALLIAVPLLLTLVAPAAAQEGGPNQAGVVVVYEDGRTSTACVTFSEPSISGIDLLQRAGFQIVVNPYGGLGYGVCAINGVGCAAGQDCFCKCQGTSCAYWTYSHRRSDGSWAISGVGGSDWQLGDGDVDGWVWGDGSTAPPVVTFEEICASSAPPPPTATPAPADPTESPPASPSPTLTPEPTITSAPLPSSSTATATLDSTRTLTPTATRTPTPIATSTPIPSPTSDVTAPAPSPSPSVTDDPVDLVGYGIFVLLLIGLATAILLTFLRRG